MKIHGEYFAGNKISEYGLKNGRVDYETLAKAFQHVLSNSIIDTTAGIGYWEQISGFPEDDESEMDEIFQYYIVDNQGAKILEKAGEVLFYNGVLDMYVWGVTHFGTAWDYVLTDIEVEKEEAA